MKIVPSGPDSKVDDVGGRIPKGERRNEPLASIFHGNLPANSVFIRRVNYMANND